MATVLRDCAALRPRTANLLSGGVDSSYLQAVWNRVAPDGGDLPPSFSVSVDHPRTWLDTDYAMTAAQALGTRHTLAAADGPYATTCSTRWPRRGSRPTTCRPRTSAAGAGDGGARGDQRPVRRGGRQPVRRGHGRRRARRAWINRSFPVVPCGVWVRPSPPESASRGRRKPGGWRIVWSDEPISNIRLIRWLVRRSGRGDGVLRGGRRAASGGGAAGMLDRFRMPPKPLDRLHGAGFLGEAVDSASLWTTLFNRAGADLLCPFLDSRMLRFALNLPPDVRFRFRTAERPAQTRAGAARAAGELAQRGKLGFGQPIFEWLAPGGQLRPLVDRIEPHDFVARRAGPLAGEAELVPLQPALLRPVAQAVHRTLAAPVRSATIRHRACAKERNGSVGTRACQRLTWIRISHMSQMWRVPLSSWKALSHAALSATRPRRVVPVVAVAAGDLAQLRYQREFERTQFLAARRHSATPIAPPAHPAGPRLRPLPLLPPPLRASGLVPQDVLRSWKTCGRCRRWRSATSRSTATTWSRGTGRAPT